MKKYFSYFKLRFNVALQYRASTVAGMFTQFFWAILQILIFIAFYKNSSSSNISLEQIISYVWLRQAFYTLINHSTDSQIRTSIENGDVSYELIRPASLYWMWFSKTIATRVSTGFIRCIPILVIAPLLPIGINLKPPIGIDAFIGFVISLCLGIFIIAAIINLFYISIFYTMTSKGLQSIFYSVLEFFGGGFIPIALMPIFWQKVCYLLPISLATDLPFRIYTGNITFQNGMSFIGVQLIWITILIFIGNKLLNKMLSKAVIQGG